SDANLTTQVGTGSSFTTPSLSTTTIYYVNETSGAGCVGSAASATATVDPIPNMPVATGNSRCGNGTLLLTASGSGGTLNWYSDLGLPTQVGTGASFTPPSLSATTTYYVTETSAAGCVSPAASAIATINPVANAPVATGNSRCGVGTVTLSASGSGGTLKW